MKVVLNDYVEIVNERVDISEADSNSYVSTDNLLPNRGGVDFPAKNLPKTRYVQTYKRKDILISNIRPYFKKIWLASESGTKSNDVLCFRTKNRMLLQEYLYVVLQSDNFFDYVTRTSKGTKMPRGDKDAIKQYQFDLPDLEEQFKIANSILILENKIKLNKAINDNLDELLTTIFEEKVNSPKFSQRNLTDIANYRNGLAMQKFRPDNDQESMPVLKIKELNQGYTDGTSDRCSVNIDPSVIVKIGDIIFSWSGTLLVKNWSGKTAGLNQHLFKVTSENYPDWFIYEWTKHHLRRFQSIAAGKATTMGHIKRKDLKDSTVYIPDNSYLTELDRRMKPIYNKRLEIIKENQELNNLRQALLQKYF